MRVRGAEDPFQQHRRLVFAAIKSGDVARVKALLNTRYIEIDRVDDRGTLLAAAVARPNYEVGIIDMLLAHGADPWIDVGTGFNIVQLAFHGRSFAFVQKIIASLEAKQHTTVELAGLLNSSGRGEPVLILAIRAMMGTGGNTLNEVSANKEFLLFLQTKGANINIGGGRGQTAFMIVASLHLKYWWLDYIGMLKEMGADVNARDMDGRTALSLCITNPAVLYALLNLGADPNLADNCGLTPIDYIHSDFRGGGMGCWPHKFIPPSLRLSRDALLARGAVEHSLPARYRCFDCSH